MFKKLLGLVFLLSFSAYTQDTIRIKLDSYKQYDKLMLYRVVGANQKYMANSDLKGGQFEMVLSKDSPVGMYRLYFDSNNGYFDFIYNHENVTVTFDPSDPEATAVFENSEENKIYQSYLNKIELQQYKLDSLQYAYFTPEKEGRLLRTSYQSELPKLYELQNDFETQSEGTLAYHLSRPMKNTMPQKLSKLQNCI